MNNNKLLISSSSLARITSTNILLYFFSQIKLVIPILSFGSRILKYSLKANILIADVDIS
ncbi:hypothetical protein M433DRAFT_152647 [Acidomyces richmondensis BFW]|nr:MAG: hypothetical protein FE78DRAFT_87956 [Acidomyces sp. 'richmondensis']KYG47105.1 hypothetical protein M433DRAFT_152647 [Acidomyces richmondensis BFW]